MKEAKSKYRKESDRAVKKDSRSLDNLRFDNRFVREFPADKEEENVPRQVSGALYSWVNPKPMESPELVAYSPEVASILGLSDEACRTAEFTRVFTGNKILDGMKPHSTCYGGHQFGQWAGQLGDGRAINLGEVVNEKGEHWTLQLKGAGPTPYRRMADGLAVLRSSLREFLCSEAMFHLGVPTTRALSLTLTGEYVLRDMFYDGHPKFEPGAVVCRVAPSFTRFGHFQILAARNDSELLQRLMDFTISTDFSHLGDPSSETYIKWFREVCRKTLEMIVHWMRVGFVHGVMNTDNMSVLGLTIDYGPYGWLENYDPMWTPNTTDAHGRRYCFGNQPKIAQWNLAQLANAIFPLINRPEPLQEAIDQFAMDYEKGWREMMAKKLGLVVYEPATDRKLIDNLVHILGMVETDMTIFFRRLAHVEIDEDSEKSASDENLVSPLLPAYYQPETLAGEVRSRTLNWLRAYEKRLKKDGVTQAIRRRRMNAVNPKYVLRNYMAQQAIDKAELGDFSMTHELLELLRRPYDAQPEKEKFAQKRPEWARNRPGCSMLSCSS